MIWNLIAIAATLFAGILVQSGQPAPDETVYIALGDSIPAGIGSSLPRERSYPAILGEVMAGHLETTVRVENLARPGETAVSFLSGEQLMELAALTDDLEGANASISMVTLSLGGNEVLDLWDGTDEERSAALSEFSSDYPAALAATRDLIGSDTPLIVSTVYDPTGGDAGVEFSDSWWIARFNSVIRDAALAADAPLVDLADERTFDAASLTRYPVDLHPTNEGHERIAALFWTAAGLDTEPPDVEITSSAVASRFTPTMRFFVTGDVNQSSIDVVSNDDSVVVYGPVPLSETEYAVLVDASRSRPDQLAVSVIATDLAGNLVELEHVIEFVTRR